MQCKNILVIDDDPGIRRTLKWTLEFDGYPVAVAENGSIGLEILKSFKDPCLVLLDLMMPVMDGFHFIEEIRRTNELRIHPIVVISAIAEHTSRLGGVNEVLKKPIHPKLLLSLAERYCGRPDPRLYPSLE